MSMQIYFCRYFILLILAANVAEASDARFELSLSERIYPNSASFDKVDYSSNFGASLGIEYETILWAGALDFSFSGKLDFDEHDYNRRRGDIDEFYIRRQTDYFDVSLGVLTEFWGVAESKHLVDIINQTNIADNIDEESKLGQPALKIQTHFDWGSTQLFWMPLFRERIFPDQHARLRLRVPISDQESFFESPDKDNHHDYALRFSRILGDWDIGLSYFEGTDREPDFVVQVESDNQINLVPFYKQIKQTGLDLQYTGAGLLLKLEAIHKTARADDYRAVVSGFEYTQNGILGSAADLGYLVEYIYDKRGEEVTPFSDDIFLALRYVQNNVGQTVCLAGVYFDAETQSKVWRVEIESRIRDGLALSFEGQGFQEQPQESVLYDFRNDDYAELKLSWFF